MRDHGGEERRFIAQAPDERLPADLLLHPAFEERLGGDPQVEVRIELAAEAFDVEQGLLKQYQLRLDLDVESARRLEQLHEHAAQRDFLQRPVEDRLAHGADFAFQLVDARLGGNPSRLDVSGRDTMIVAPEEGEKILCEVVLVGLRKRAHDAEIERDVLAVIRRIGGHEDVARMHIGVKETVAEHLCEEDLHAGAGEPRNIDVLLSESIHLADRRACHPLHDHDLGARPIPVHLGDQEQR